VLCEGKVLLDGTCAEVFAQPEVLKKSFVSPPPLCRVAQGLGFAEPVFAADELVGFIRRKRGGKLYVK
jgi:energy-coupling factor transport system ATP-binding protein